MATARPAKTFGFVPGYPEPVAEWGRITYPQVIKGDRSKFVRYARSAARIASLQREGDLVASEPGFAVREQYGRHWMTCLVEATDFAPIAPSRDDRALRLLEATNAQLEPAVCVVLGDGAWLENPALLTERQIIPIGMNPTIAAVQSVADGRTGIARSQVLVQLTTEKGPPLVRRVKYSPTRPIDNVPFGLRLAEHFKVCDLPSIESMARLSSQIPCFWMTLPDGRAVSVEPKSGNMLADLDQISEGATWVEVDQAAQDRPVAFLLESLEIPEVADAFREGRLLPHHYADVRDNLGDNPILWSLRDFES